MVVEVLKKTHCLETPIKIHEMDVAGCVEHPATQLPARGSNGTSCTSSTKYSQWGKSHRDTPLVLTGSPWIGPEYEQSHFREVKFYEGKKRQVNRHQRTKNVLTQTSLLTCKTETLKLDFPSSRMVPEDRVTPEHLNLLEVEKMKKQRKDNKPLELPPLPERVIKGLRSPWVSPNGKPFHTVHLWEFPLLYVLLRHKTWQILSDFLKKHQNLSALARKLKLGRTILVNIRDNPDQSISVSTLKKLCRASDLEPEEIERSLHAVRFNKSGELEKIAFPFVMDIYAWRALCHIAGDGNVHMRKYPDLRWIQSPKNQGSMRSLLKRLSRECGGKRDQIWYPKALSYAMLGTIPGLTFNDLRTTTFLQFVLDLPMAYRDWKVEFLAAFIVDDGCISKDISFYQKDVTTLQYIIRLCDQLDYDHSHIYRQKRDGVHNFQLRQQGIEAFYTDIQNLVSKDPLLGLWHKHIKLQSVATSFSAKRAYDNCLAVEVCLTIISILGDHKQRNTEKLHYHPNIQPFLQGQPWYYLGRRLQKLVKMNLIQESLKPDNTSYRPKRWIIPPDRNPETLREKFLAKYGNRAHKHSYKRKFITRAMVEKIIEQLEAEGIEPTRKAVARKGGFSRKVLYQRNDLRGLFEDKE